MFVNKILWSTKEYNKRQNNLKYKRYLIKDVDENL